ncbi:Hypothetical protein I595_1857 [Croceitalea dokdonensis DOKDO 023]|uniref:Uncharacterized protein n=1 Tax=Croceitalea dokdonensis DOKDO 023 TaxID=1300341 RepID=A0A0P7AW78_9FLAO|nr:Hypothetical protein I595_1857 [Croceitalea dokdonensis DOKDO 023]
MNYGANITMSEKTHAIDGSKIRANIWAFYPYQMECKNILFM